MRTSRHLRLSFLTLFTLAFVVALSSCSKKEVTQDEPLISPSTGETDGAATGDQAAVPTESAGGAGLSGGETGDFSVVYFDFDSYRVNADGRNSLKANSDWLKANPTATVQIEGHCDERGTTEYNLALGERRANSARDYLVKLGVSKSRISVISYGEERPADPGHDESAWARNRRAAFVLLSK